MDECEKRVLHQFRHRLANELLVTENFLSAFCEKNVLDEEMSGIIKNELSFVARAHRLLDVLLRRGSKVFTILLDLLHITNPWLAEKMKTCYIEEKNREMKLRIQSHSTSASYDGYGTNIGRHIDDDIRQRVVSYINVHVTHIPMRDQRNIEKWMTEELQRERHRHASRARGLVVKEDVVGVPVQIITNTKEIQTDTTMNDLQEVYEDLAISLQGTEFDQDKDVSFNLLKEQVSELVDRNNKMDYMFMQCLDRFDDYNDRFRLPLPDLIDQIVMRERDAQQALTEENRLRQKLVVEKEFLERQLNSLEDDFDSLMEKHRHIMIKPQKMALQRRDGKCLVNEKNQTLPSNNLDISSGVEDRSARFKGRSASRFRTSSSRLTTKPRIWTHVAPTKAHKSTFEGVKIESASAKQWKPNKIHNLKNTV